MEYKIRKAKLSDYEIIARFQISCAKKTEGKILNRRTIETSVLMITRLNDIFKYGKYIVAENQNKEIVGCCLLQTQFSDWNCNYYLNIESVYVHPKHRGKGVMYALYEGAYGEFGIKHCEVRSVIASTNEAMQTAIKKIGFQRTHYLVFSKKIPIHLTDREN